MSKKHEPVRMCIATRRLQPATKLLRVVVDPADPTRIIPDPKRIMPGRGAWITPTLVACEQAESRRAFGRALRVSAKVDTSHVRKYIAVVETTMPAGKAVSEKD
ncbi:DUF448 domain-containing protein [Corynebacterium tuscaniense]|uniref:DUF448 domain-containing protein n=1 Tax=Corynebacterium tuscaniense TaxID=302449 RepID=A0A2N6T3Y4_9CORY|nr:YlxR family protein [Corynebacterium tuscaniense]KAA8746820.1 YlxR family protein [Corynebacterium tuscaniense]KGF25125.1 DNA-binding protein [Corynebacterium tuscaniense DNF00037]PMC64014.1 DUF448 domain-containing protein [Corynebacterium tuscaniense]